MPVAIAFGLEAYRMLIHAGGQTRCGICGGNKIRALIRSEKLNAINARVVSAQGRAEGARYAPYTGGG